MADLTRERIAELLKFPHNIQVDEIRPLLDMASRCVTEETVRAWWKYATGDLSLAAFDDAKRELLGLVSRDLQPAAEALARKR